MVLAVAGPSRKIRRSGCERAVLPSMGKAGGGCDSTAHCSLDAPDRDALCCSRKGLAALLRHYVMTFSLEASWVVQQAS